MDAPLRDRREAAPADQGRGRSQPVGLRGEIDGYAAPLLERVLDSVPHVGGDGEVVVDAAGLDFIEHRSLFALERHAERSGRRAVVLRNASGAVVRLSELLDLR